MSLKAPVDRLRFILAPSSADRTTLSASHAESQSTVVELSHHGRGVCQRPAGGRRRPVRLPAAGRRLGLEQRRARGRRRADAPDRHAVRPEADGADAVRRCAAPSRPPGGIDTLVNTHANGDHCYGNQLVADARIVASERTASEMAELPATAMAALVEQAPKHGRAGRVLPALLRRLRLRRNRAGAPATSASAAS